MPILAIKGLCKKFGAMTVLNGVELNVKKGSLHAIVGPNGAGKTTLFNVICGFLNPTRGGIFFENREITNMTPDKISKMGIQRSFQNLELFSELTVLENVRLAVQSMNKRNINFFRKASHMRDTVYKAYEILQLLGLANKAEFKASELSHGEERYLDLGIALGSGGNLLLLDEPTSGLVHDEIPDMGETIRKLVPDKTVLIIEHRIEMLLSVADIITVLDYGKVIAEGSPKELRDNEAVTKAYLGLR
jgi:branched-chain amino acid transport system ATP-binding protein